MAENIESQFELAKNAERAALIRRAEQAKLESAERKRQQSEERRAEQSRREQRAELVSSLSSLATQVTAELVEHRIRPEHPIKYVHSELLMPGFFRKSAKMRNTTLGRTQGWLVTSRLLPGQSGVDKSGPWSNPNVYAGFALTIDGSILDVRADDDVQKGRLLVHHPSDDLLEKIADNSNDILKGLARLSLLTEGLKPNIE